MKKIIFIFIVLILYSLIAKSENCRTELECDPSRCYCIRVCDEITGIWDTLCIKNLHEIPSGKKARLVSIADMPICIDFIDSTFPGSSYSYYPEVIMDKEGIREDIEDAVRDWNCLCDFKEGDCKNKIKAHFSEDKSDLRWEDRGVLAYARTLGECDIDVNSPYTYMIFNNTSFFRYQDKGEIHEGAPVCSFINRKYEHLLSSLKTGRNYFFSFYDLVLHEFAHILGFLHPTDCGRIEPSTVMHSVSTANIISQGLSSYDKCMFIALYCPFVSIEEKEEVIRPNVSIIPNPASKELNISFEILDGTKSVTIQILNEQGQLLETLLTNAIYNSGIHIYSASLDLPSGIYFVLTKIKNTIYSEKIIIK